MQTLGYFLIWGAFIFFMMRFGCGAHVMGHGHSHHHDNGNPGTLPSVGVVGWTPPAKDIDPVCGMTIDTAGSKSTVLDGHVYHFCSQDCREKFEASPKSYTSGAVRPTLNMEHTHEHQH
jgi:YHS domain-containing protein